MKGPIRREHNFSLASSRTCRIDNLIKISAGGADEHLRSMPGILRQYVSGKEVEAS
jgi:hypothetical protein